MSVRLTSPANLALTGPTLSTTLALISVGEAAVMVSQPGMHFCKILGSFNPRHTILRGALMSWLPDIFIVSTSLLRGSDFFAAASTDFDRGRKTDFFRRDGFDVNSSRLTMSEHRAIPACDPGLVSADQLVKISGFRYGLRIARVMEACGLFRD